MHLRNVNQDGGDEDVQILLGVLKDQTNYNGSVDCYKSM